MQCVDKHIVVRRARENKNSMKTGDIRKARCTHSVFSMTHESLNRDERTLECVQTNVYIFANTI